MICYTPFLPTGYGVPTLSELFFGPIQLPTTTAPGRPISFGMKIFEKDTQSGSSQVFKHGELSGMVRKLVGTKWESTSQIAKRLPIKLTHTTGVRYALLQMVKEGHVVSKKYQRQTFYKRNPSSGATSVV